MDQPMPESAATAWRRRLYEVIGTVLALILIIGSLMYLIEGEQHGFTNIPQSI